MTKFLFLLLLYPALSFAGKNPPRPVPACPMIGGTYDLAPSREGYGVGKDGIRFLAFPLAR